MNEEIKEILVSLNSQCKSAKGCINSYFRVEYIQKLLDYITNLQQENESLKKKLDRRYYKNEYERVQQENERLKKNQRLSPEERQHFHLDIDEIYEILIDYKSRCEKASDKLGKYKHYSTPTEEQNSENEEIVDSALNILQNGSDSQ